MPTKSTYLLFVLGLLLAGCGREEKRHRELLAKLEEVQAGLDALGSQRTKHEHPLRWAFANRNQITSAIYQWSQAKMEEIKKSEALPPATEEKIARYEALNNKLMSQRMSRMRPRNLPPFAGAPPPVTDQEYEELSRTVDAAKAPVAEIVDRRNRQATQFRDQFPVEQLVAEYAKDRYDLVIDTNDKVLYRSSGEAHDITQAVINYFNQKEKP